MQSTKLLSSRWVRVTLVAALALAVMIVWLALGPGDVSKAALPENSALSPYLSNAAYVDAYRMLVPRERFPDVRSLDAISFQKGELVTRTAQDVVYRDFAPGLIFYVGYSSRRADGHMASLEMSTVVHTLNWKGSVNFAFVRPIHRLGVPWVFRYLVRRALADRSQRIGNDNFPG